MNLILNLSPPWLVRSRIHSGDDQAILSYFITTKYFTNDVIGYSMCNWC